MGSASVRAFTFKEHEMLLEQSRSTLRASGPCQPYQLGSTQRSKSRNCLKGRKKKTRRSEKRPSSFSRKKPRRSEKSKRRPRRPKKLKHAKLRKKLTGKQLRKKLREKERPKRL